MNGSVKNTSTENELLWVLGLLFIAAVAAWFFGHAKISAFVMKIRTYESYLLIFDTEARDTLRSWIAATNPADATLKQLWLSGFVAGRSLRWVVFLIITGLFGYLIYRSPDRSGRYTQSYTTDTLAMQEASEWPSIRPVLGMNMIDIPIDDPINGMRQRPRDYGRRHGMIVPIAGLNDKENPAIIELLDHKDALKLDRVREIFSKQIGKIWQGVSGMKEYERCLFAAFSAQINNNNSMAQDILDDLAVSYLDARKRKNVNLITSKLAQKALLDYGNGDVVKRIASRHAYTRTILMSMLTAARENGVMPASWFRWLKTVDRVTWYALNDLGLDVASVEAAGTRAHWQAESLAKTPLVNPMIEPALVGLKTYLGELIDVEEDA